MELQGRRKMQMYRPGIPIVPKSNRKFGFALTERGAKWENTDCSLMFMNDKRKAYKFRKTKLFKVLRSGGFFPPSHPAHPVMFPMGELSAMRRKKKICWS